MADEVKPIGLPARIVAAMKQVGTVAKAGKNKDQGYAYQKAADIFEAVQGAFGEAGVCLLADEKGVEWPDPMTTKNGATMFVCRATMAYTLVDIETGEERTCHSTGIGYDTSDKALNKAKTMAEKYFLKQLLLIGEDEDDADQDTIEPQVTACPACGVVGAIIKGKEEYGGGWLCFGKKGGCGAKFTTDPALQQDEQKAQKRPKNGRKSKPASTPTPKEEKPADGAADPSSGPLETAAEIDEDVAQLRELVEATQFPGGIEKFLGIFRVKSISELNQKQRTDMRRTLEKRAGMIERGELTL